jgi:hypothetical protein
MGAVRVCLTCLAGIVVYQHMRHFFAGAAGVCLTRLAPLFLLQAI